MAEIAAQIETSVLTLGEITNAEDLAANLAENAIPSNLSEVTAGSYKPEVFAAAELIMARVRV